MQADQVKKQQKDDKLILYIPWMPIRSSHSPLMIPQIGAYIFYQNSPCPYSTGSMAWQSLSLLQITSFSLGSSGHLPCVWSGVIIMFVITKKAPFSWDTKNSLLAEIQCTCSLPSMWSPPISFFLLFWHCFVPKNILTLPHRGLLV